MREKSAKNISMAQEDYVVKAIRGWRYHWNKKCIEFYIQWEGYDESENTWEPRDFLHCPDVLKKFIANLPPKQARFYNVDQYEKLTGFQRNATYVNCVGADGPHEFDSRDPTKPDENNYYCLIQFEDCDLVEEVGIREFFEFAPEEALKFLEQRILVSNEQS